MDIAVDVGGTFTDVVIRDDEGSIRGYKSPTTPSDLSEGVFDGLRLAAADIGLDLGQLLESTDRFSFGTTVATNAILEHKVARTAFLATEGFRDVLSIREGGKDDTYNIALAYPPPYVPGELTFEIRERMTAEGAVHIPLDEASVVSAIERCREGGVQTIVVSLLWSIANPAHERRVGELIEAHLPDMPFSLGHQVNPCVREYRRTSAAAIDASLKPVVSRNVERMQAELERRGFRGTLAYVTSNGGQTSTREILDKPVYLCFSGPSAAPAAGRRFADVESIGEGNVVTVDMGGTSFDVSIVTGGEIPMHREGRIAGHVFGVPSVEVHTIGAGGGSIARVDSGGFIHVGPQSAGAHPGPACYGRGGQRPTVTDANLVSGALGESLSPGGGMVLSAESATAAIERDVAAPLGVTASEAAALVTLACEQNMVAAIEDLTVKRGVDPREYVMVAGGAAAGLHAAGMARELGIRRVIIPAMGGVLSAFGILASDVSFNFGRSHFTSSERFDFEGVSELLSSLEADAVRYLERMRIPAGARVLVRTCEARYAGQVWQLTLPLPTPRVANEGELAQLVEHFHQLHQRVYAVRSDADPVEVTEWNVRAVGRREEVRIPELRVASGVSAPAPISARRAYLGELRELVDVPVYRTDAIPVEHEVAGPAFVDAPLGNIVVSIGSTLRLTRFGSFVLDVATP